jgi:hypothetical protein
VWHAVPVRRLREDIHLIASIATLTLAAIAAVHWAGPWILHKTAPAFRVGGVMYVVGALGLFLLPGVLKAAADDRRARERELRRASVRAEGWRYVDDEAFYAGVLETRPLRLIGRFLMYAGLIAYAMLGFILLGGLGTLVVTVVSVGGMGVSALLLALACVRLGARLKLRYGPGPARARAGVSERED